MHLLLAISAFVAIAAAQDCSDCQRGLHSAQRRRFATELKPRLDACFTQHGCRSPGPVMEAARNCKERVLRRRLAPALRACPGVDSEAILRQLTGEKRRHGGKGRRGGVGAAKAAKAAKLADAFCPDRASASAALACIKGVMASAGGNGGEAISTGCQEAARNPICRQQWQARKEAVCDCAESWSVDEAAVAAELKACLPAALRDAVAERAGRLGGRRQGSEGGLKGRLCGKAKGQGQGRRGGRRFGGSRRGGRGGWRG